MSGIGALHAVSLVHCDIKLDNVFLTAHSGFAPFGICAKIGDLDTCRSLKGDHRSATASPMGASAPRSAFRDDSAGGDALAAASAGLRSANNVYFTSCMKGTPGYLAVRVVRSAQTGCKQGRSDPPARACSPR